MSPAELANITSVILKDTNSYNLIYINSIGVNNNYRFGIHAFYGGTHDNFVNRIAACLGRLQGL
uniref:Predicted protein n=1 Tax=Hordeum vulgare subsp. vulgare TaxID=112509 RepID=F2DHE6_HORVV|nr:predicted protein [Hordeum vulgare subsp. vulgare]